MELIFNSLELSPQLRRMLDSPVLKPQIKRSIMEEIFGKVVTIDSLNFIYFVINKNRENILYSILKKFLELKDEHFGIANVEVKTAFAFTTDQQQSLIKKLETLLNKKIELKITIDRDIIGGFIARIRDTVYDASVKHQLEILKKQFLQGSIALN
jgi:F-type H+-transporting ATPase subunit delta